METSTQIKNEIEGTVRKEWVEHASVCPESGFWAALKRMSLVRRENIPHIDWNRHQQSFVVKYKGTTHICSKVTS